MGHCFGLRASGLRVCIGIQVSGASESSCVAAMQTWAGRVVMPSMRCLDVPAAAACHAVVLPPSLWPQHAEHVALSDSRPCSACQDSPHAGPSYQLAAAAARQHCTMPDPYGPSPVAVTHTCARSMCMPCAPQCIPLICNERPGSKPQSLFLALHPYVAAHGQDQ